MTDKAKNQLHLIFVSAVVIKKGKALIGKRSLHETHNAGLWGIPGGKIDQTKGGVDHILEKTVTREVEEETGIEIDQRSLRYIYSDTFIRSSGHHVVALVFLCKWKLGKAKPLEDTEDIAWVGPKDLTKFDFAGGTRNALQLAFGLPF